MRMLSTAAWVAHNLGLSACFGGLLFGKAALNPSLSAIDSEADRGKLLNTTWNLYNVINIISFATAAATWCGYACRRRTYPSCSRRCSDGDTAASGTSRKCAHRGLDARKTSSCREVLPSAR